MTDHPITPPPELVEQWVSLACEYEGNETWIDLATQAARWGADQELEACVSYVDNNFSGNKARALRAVRRPKPPSLKEQALAVLDDASNRLDAAHENILRRALEALDE